MICWGGGLVTSFGGEGTYLWGHVFPSFLSIELVLSFHFIYLYKLFPPNHFLFPNFVT